MRYATPEAFRAALEDRLKHAQGEKIGLSRLTGLAPGQSSQRTYRSLPHSAADTKQQQHSSTRSLQA